MATTVVETSSQLPRPWLALYGVRLRPRPRALTAEQEVSSESGAAVACCVVAVARVALNWVQSPHTERQQQACIHVVLYTLFKLCVHSTRHHAACVALNT